MSMGHIAHMNFFVSFTVFSMKEKVSRGVFSRTLVLASAREISKYLQKIILASTRSVEHALYTFTSCSYIEFI